MSYQVPNCSSDLLSNKNLITRQNKTNPTTKVHSRIFLATDFPASYSLSKELIKMC